MDGRQPLPYGIMDYGRVARHPSAIRERGAQNFPLLGGRDLTCPAGTRLSGLIVTSGVLGLNRPRNENMKARPLPPVQAAAGSPLMKREESRLEDLMAVNNHKPYTRGRA